MVKVYGDPGVLRKARPRILLVEMDCLERIEVWRVHLEGSVGGIRYIINV